MTKAKNGVRIVFVKSFDRDNDKAEGFLERERGHRLKPMRGGAALDTTREQLPESRRASRRRRGAHVTARY